MDTEKTMSSGILQRAVDSVFGYDFFISYSHSDGKHYPGHLKAGLEKAGFKVFLDQADYAAGIDLRRETSRQVRKSRKVVIVGRTAALESVWVRREVEAALAYKKTPILINVNEALQAARETSELAQLAIRSHWLRLEETIDTPDGAPSDHAIAELARSFNATRQETKRQRVFAGAAAAFACAAAIAVWAAIEANSNKREAQAQQQVAIENAARARKSEAAAQESEAAARKSERQAKLDRDKALTTQSRFLADVATRQVISDRQTALLLTLEALPDNSSADDVRRNRPYVREAAIALDRAWRAPGTHLWSRTYPDVLRDVRFSSDRRSILATSDNPRVLDAATGDVLVNGRDVDKNVDGADFVADSPMVVFYAASRVIGWDTGARGATYTFDAVAHHNLAKTGLLLTSPSKGPASIRDAKSGREICKLDQPVAQSKFTGPSDRLVSWKARAIQIWDARLCRVLGRPFAAEADVRDVGMTADGSRMVAALSNNTFAIWDVSTQRLFRTVRGTINQSGLDFISPDGKKLALYKNGTAAAIIDINTGRELVSIDRKSGEDSDEIIFNRTSDGILYVPDEGPSVPEFWIVGDKPSNHPLFRLEGHGKGFVRAARFSPDGTSIASGGDDGNVRLWDSRSGQLRAVLPLRELVSSIDFSSDGKQLVAASDALVGVWDLQQGQRDARPSGSPDTISPAQQGGELPASVSSILGNEYKVLAISPDRKRAVVASKALLLLNVETISIVGALDNRVDFREVRFSRDSKRALGIRNEQEVKISDGVRYPQDKWHNEAIVWDAGSGHPLANISEDATSSWVADFFEDGILTVSGSGTYLWRYFANLQQAVDAIKAAAPGCLNENERMTYFLDEDPPRWCITGPGLEHELDSAKWMGKPPYNTAQWKAWLTGRDKGQNPARPDALTTH